VRSKRIPTYLEFAPEWGEFRPEPADVTGFAWLPGLLGKGGYGIGGPGRDESRGPEQQQAGNRGCSSDLRDQVTVCGFAVNR
jgi:hypothetical protein